MAYQVFGVGMTDQQSVTDHLADGGIIVRFEVPYADYGCFLWASMSDDEIDEEMERAFKHKWGRSIPYPGHDTPETLEDWLDMYLAVVEYHGRDTWYEQVWESDRYSGEDEWKTALPEAEAEYEKMCSTWPGGHFTLELFADFGEYSERWQTLRDNEEGH